MTMIGWHLFAITLFRPHYIRNDGTAVAASVEGEGEEAGIGEDVAKTNTIVGDGEATHKASLSAIALETDMVGWFQCLSSSS